MGASRSRSLTRCSRPAALSWAFLSSCASSLTLAFRFSETCSRRVASPWTVASTRSSCTHPWHFAPQLRGLGLEGSVRLGLACKSLLTLADPLLQAGGLVLRGGQLLLEDPPRRLRDPTRSFSSSV